MNTSSPDFDSKLNEWLNEFAAQGGLNGTDDTRLGLKTNGTPTPPAAFNPDDLVPIEEVARRLCTDVNWVREKCRRRCPNPIPVYNLGRHLLFDWAQVSEWIRNSARPVHAKHIRRTKEQIEAETSKRTA
jgi:hypothetical protein